MKLREQVDALCLKRLGRKPNLENPTGYNDKIQWLKLYDQRKEHITACDKWAVRDTVPKKHLVPARLGVSPEWMPAVLKCSHGSGGTRIVNNEGELARAQQELVGRLLQPYGIPKGEWAYQFVTPRLFTERLLEPNITDYKFHCVHGKIAWVQVIADRRNGAKETILAPDGRATWLHFDHNMRHAPDAKVFPGDLAWFELTQLAQKLAKPWRYVRVDLFWSDGRAWFGELTFWPLAGAYRTKDEPAFGELLDIDLTQKREPIVL